MKYFFPVNIIHGYVEVMYCGLVNPRDFTLSLKKNKKQKNVSKSHALGAQKTSETSALVV